MSKRLNDMTKDEILSRIVRWEAMAATENIFIPSYTDQLRREAQFMRDHLAWRERAHMED